MTVQRKKPPKHVIWDQAAILRRIADLEAAITAFTSSSENPTSDTQGTVVRNVRDYEILSAISQQTEVLERIEQQLIFLTEIEP